VQAGGVATLIRGRHPVSRANRSNPEISLRGRDGTIPDIPRDRNDHRYLRAILNA
jgi:hypothetical protein